MENRLPVHGIVDYGDSHASFTVGTQSAPPSPRGRRTSSPGPQQRQLRCDFYAHGRSTACHVYVGEHTSHGAFETTKYTFEPVNQYTLQVDRPGLRGEEVPSGRSRTRC